MFGNCSKIQLKGFILQEKAMLGSCYISLDTITTGHVYKSQSGSHFAPSNSFLK